MRKIESQMLLAIENRKDWNCDNTRVDVIYFAHGDKIIDRINVYLHNNKIAQITPDSVTVCDCGWQTTTTKSRLNAILRYLCNSAVSQAKHVWYGHPKDAPTFEFESHTEYTFARI